MSVIPFNKSEVYKKMADAYETLKGFMKIHGYRPFDEDEYNKFYRALRRLYFANVATFLCQYHDDSPETELDTLIDPFTSLEGKNTGLRSTNEVIASFVNNFKSLEYNLCTNDGGKFVEVDSYDYLKDLAFSYMVTWMDYQTVDPKTHTSRY